VRPPLLRDRANDGSPRERVELDPVEVRRRNLIQPRSSRTARRLRLYDSATTRPSTRRSSWRAIRRSGTSRRGRAPRVAASASGWRWPSTRRVQHGLRGDGPRSTAPRKPEYLPKSGAVDAATIRVDRSGASRVLATSPRAGHQTVVCRSWPTNSGHPEDVTVVDEMDTYTRFWSISSGTYSSRFGSVGTSAVALAARAQGEADRVRGPISWSGGGRADVPRRRGAGQGRHGASYSVKDLAGRATGTRNRCPRAWSRVFQATAVFGFTGSTPSTRTTASTRRIPTASSPR